MSDGAEHKPAEKKVVTTRPSTAERKIQFNRQHEKEQNTYRALSGALDELIAGGVVEEDSFSGTLHLAFKNITGIQRLNLYWSDADSHALMPYQFYRLNERLEMIGRNFSFASAAIGKTLEEHSLAHIMLLEELTHSNSLFEKLVEEKLTLPLGICWNKKRRSIHVFDLDPNNQYIHKANQDEFMALSHMFEMPSGIIVPLLYKKGLLGVMEVCGSNLYFDGDERNADSLIRYIVGVGRILALHKKIQTDPLTRLLPKEMFEDGLRKKVQESLESGRPLSLIYLDGDDFKTINDTYGHAVGDRVLRNIAKRILESTHSYDRDYRVGGEEFAILTNVPPPTAIKIAQRIAGNIMRPLRVEMIGDIGETEYIDLSRTVSIGIAPLTVTDLTAHDTVEKVVMKMKRLADEALYRAKSEPNKNSVYIAEPVDGKIEYRKV